MTDNPLIEAVDGGLLEEMQRAIAVADGWTDWWDYKDHALAALRAIEDAGWKVVKA